MRTRPLFFLAALTLSACNGGGGATGTSAPSAPGAHVDVELKGESLGTVNGMKILAADFDLEASRRLGAAGNLTAEDRQSIIDSLVEHRLLYQEALRKGLDKDPKVQKMMVNMLLKEDVYASVTAAQIADDELEAYFNEHKDEFIIPEKVQVKRITLAAKEGQSMEDLRKQAAELRAQIQADRSQFRVLAQQHSSGPYAQRGGDLGFLDKDGKPGVPDRVVEVAFGLKKGQVSEPFETAEGVNLVYVPNRRERVERDFAQMKGSVLRKVKSDRYRSQYDDYVGRLRKGAEVVVDEAKVADRKVEAPNRPRPMPGSLRSPGVKKQPPQK